MEAGKFNRRSKGRDSVKDERGIKVTQEEKRLRFEVIYQNNQHDMYKVALYYTQQEQAAMEITQKAFYNLYLHFDRVEPSRMRAYVARSIRNMTYNWTRDNKIAKEGNIEDYYEELMIDSLEEIIVRKEEKRIAWELASDILANLYDKNIRWYEVIMLVYYLEIPQEQVAKDQGVEKDVISSRLYRAKQWIRQNYKEQYEESMGR